ncbi:hypothetical protein D3C78_1827390 [compost metagenome]
MEGIWSARCNPSQWFGPQRGPSPADDARRSLARSDRIARKGFTTIDAYQGAMDIAGALRGQEHSQVGDVIDFTPALERNGFGEVIDIPRLFHQGTG